MSDRPGPIGIFDSGYGGLTVFKEIKALLPEYDYLYLGDNARTPYGTRSLEIVHRYTLECVDYLFDQGCRLIILACNTASAMALRTIQQRDLDHRPATDRVLGILRPTTEIIGSLTRSGHIGLFATEGTVNAGSYVIEAAKFAPEVTVHQQACPLWVPLVENDEIGSIAADELVKKYTNALIEKAPEMDAVLLACTHYPLLIDTIRKHLPERIEIVSQGELTAQSLKDYLQRHSALEALCSKSSRTVYQTTGDAEKFDVQATRFFGETVQSTEIDIAANRG